MAETLTRWLLELLWDEWPEATLPRDVVRKDADDHYILEWDQRKRSIEQTDVAVIEVSRDATDPTPEGPGLNYETIETVDVELSAVVSDEWGPFDSHAEFRRLVDNAKAALDVERSYPSISLEDRTRQPTRLTMLVGSEQDRSSTHRDHYAVGFAVRLRGKLDADPDL